MAQYGPEQFWYPDETLAANVSADVFPRNSNVHASIFSDAGLTIPQANPTSTDGSGFLSFYATAGDYWIHIGGLTFDVTINDGSDDSWHTTYVFTQSVASASWMIFHEMGTRPDVTVHDFADTLIEYASVSYPNANTVQVDFNSPRTGKARLRR